jgi:hypothetical protein
MKPTKRENFATLTAIVEGSSASAETKSAMLNFIAHEVELLERKSSKLTPRQKENAQIAETILTIVREAELPLTISHMMKDARITAIPDITSQRVTAIASGMVKEDKTLIRTEVKKVAYFAPAD